MLVLANRFLAAISALVMCVSPLLAQAQANELGRVEGHGPDANWRRISPQSVREAASFSLPEIDWQPAKFNLRPALAAAGCKSRLRIAETRSGRDLHSLELKLDCLKSEGCAPFWVEAVFPNAAGRGLGNARLPPARLSQTLLKPFPLVRPGKLASLEFDDRGLRIFMQVMPLKRGRLGENVKVFDPETRRIFLAKVEGINLLRSDLVEAK